MTFALVDSCSCTFLFVFPSRLCLCYCLSVCLSILWQLFAIYFAYLPHTRSPLKHQLHQRAEVAQVKPSPSKNRARFVPSKTIPPPSPRSDPKMFVLATSGFAFATVAVFGICIWLHIFISIPFFTAGAQWVIRYNCRTGGQRVSQSHWTFDRRKIWGMFYIDGLIYGMSGTNWGIVLYKLNGLQLNIYGIKVN